MLKLCSIFLIFFITINGSTYSEKVNTGDFVTLENGMKVRDSRFNFREVKQEVIPATKKSSLKGHREALLDEDGIPMSVISDTRRSGITRQQEREQKIIKPVTKTTTTNVRPLKTRKQNDKNFKMTERRGRRPQSPRRRIKSHRGYPVRYHITRPNRRPTTRNDRVHIEKTFLKRVSIDRNLKTGHRRTVVKTTRIIDSDGILDIILRKYKRNHRRSSPMRRNHRRSSPMRPKRMRHNRERVVRLDRKSSVRPEFRNKRDIETTTTTTTELPVTSTTTQTPVTTTVESEPKTTVATA